MISGPKVARLEDGRPHFRFFHRGGGVYDVYAALRERASDVALGRIRTVAPIAHGTDPGKWRVVRADDVPFDSMDAAAIELLKTVIGQVATREERQAA
jgi:hypothetical protein